jgi:hypothetical protein
MCAPTPTHLKDTTFLFKTGLRKFEPWSEAETPEKKLKLLAQRARHSTAFL